MGVFCNKEGAKVRKRVAGCVMLFLRLSEFWIVVLTFWGFNAFIATWRTGVTYVLFTKQFTIQLFS
jgi:hypothetical protein